MSNSTERLDRLDGYLRQDPDNTALAVEAFELALNLGLHERAGAYLTRPRPARATIPTWLIGVPFAGGARPLGRGVGIAAGPLPAPSGGCGSGRCAGQPVALCRPP